MGKRLITMPWIFPWIVKVVKFCCIFLVSRIFVTIRVKITGRFPPVSPGQQDRRDHLLDGGQCHAAVKVVQRLFQRDPHLVLAQNNAEFLIYGVRHLVDDRLQGLDKAKPSAERAGHDHQGVDQLVVEFVPRPPRQGLDIKAGEKQPGNQPEKNAKRFNPCGKRK